MQSSLSSVQEQFLARIRRPFIGRLAFRVAMVLLCALVVLAGYGLLHVVPKANARATGGAPIPALDLGALKEPLQEMTPAEREILNNALQLIKQKQHLLALASLTRLAESNPDNSAVRVLRAYVLLELGRVSGALDDASLAEGTGKPTAYKCWFLAQIAYLGGNEALCRREIGHVSKDPTYGAQAEKLRRQLDSKER